MPGPTRFPDGIQLWESQAGLGDMRFPDATKFIHYVEEFIDAGDFVAATPTNWTVTAVGAGTRARANTAGGVVTITNAAADNDSVSVQKTNRSYVFTSGRRLFFMARLSLSDVVESDMFMGLSDADTTPIGGAGSEETGVNNGVFFLKIDGSALLRAFVRVGGSTIFSNLSLATMVNDQMMNMAFAFDGRIGTSDLPGELSFWTKIDSEDVWTKRVGFDIDASGDLPSAVLSSNMSIQNGEAVAKIMNVDTLLVHNERFIFPTG